MKLNEISVITMGQSPKSIYYNKKHLGIPFLQGGTTFGKLYPTYETWTTKWSKEAIPNDILFTVRAPVGNLNICTKRTAIGRGIASIRAKTIDYKYLFYVLSLYSKQIKQVSTGSIFGSINKEELGNIELKINKKIKQSHIVDIIGSIDEQINCIDEQIGKLEIINKYLFKYMFFNKFKKAKLKKCPIISNEYVTTINNNVSLFHKTKMYIATANVKDTSINSYDSFVDYHHRPSRANNLPIANSIWFAKMKSTSKKILVLPRDKYLINNYIFSTGFMGLQISRKYLSYFWTFICLKEFEDIKNKMSSGATQQAIDKTTLGELNILIPTDSNLFEYFGNHSLPILDKINSLKEKRNILIKHKKAILPLLICEQIY